MEQFLSKPVNCMLCNRNTFEYCNMNNLIVCDTAQCLINKTDFHSGWNDYHFHSSRRVSTERDVNDSALLWFPLLRLLLSGPWTGVRAALLITAYTHLLRSLSAGNTKQCVTQETATGYYKPNSRWTRWSRLQFFIHSEIILLSLIIIPSGFPHPSTKWHRESRSE